MENVMRRAGVPRWVLPIIGVAVVGAAAVVVVSTGVGASDLANLGSAAAPQSTLNPLPTFEVDGAKQVVTSVTLPANVPMPAPPPARLPWQLPAPGLLTVTRLDSSADDWFRWHELYVITGNGTKNVSLIYADASGAARRWLNFQDCTPFTLKPVHSQASPQLVQMELICNSVWEA